jgi:polysaccharide pyruvyl transferase CsaB
MRLVVSGYYGYANAGDEAVLAGMLATFRAVEPSFEAVVLSGDPEHTRRTHGVEAIRRTDLPAVARTLRAGDGLISGGGSLLQDRTSPRPIAYYTGVMHLARVLGRPYVVHAQGLGPIRLRANRWLAAAGLRGAARVTLRDAASVDLARELGVRRPIELAPDPALAMVSTPDESPRHVLVAIRDWGGADAHLAGLLAALRRLAADHPILAMPMQDPADRETSERIVDGIDGASVMPPGADLEAQLAAIGGSVLVIGMRLHALILAAAAHVPALAISYDPKVDAFAAHVGQPVVGRVGEPIDEAALVAAARAALDTDPAPYVARVEELRSRLRPDATATLAALRRPG